MGKTLVQDMHLCMLPLSSAATTCRDCVETGEKATTLTEVGWCIRIIDFVRSRMSFAHDHLSSIHRNRHEKAYPYSNITVR